MRREEGGASIQTPLPRTRSTLHLSTEGQKRYRKKQRGGVKTIKPKELPVIMGVERRGKQEESLVPGPHSMVVAKPCAEAAPPSLPWTASRVATAAAAMPATLRPFPGAQRLTQWAVAAPHRPFPLCPHAELRDEPRHARADGVTEDG